MIAARGFCSHARVDSTAPGSPPPESPLSDRNGCSGLTAALDAATEGVTRRGVGEGVLVPSCLLMAASMSSKVGAAMRYLFQVSDVFSHLKPSSNLR